MKKTVVYMLVISLLLTMAPIVKAMVLTVEASQAEVMKQKGNLEGRSAGGCIQETKGEKVIEWCWTAGDGIAGVKGYRTLWSAGKKPKKTELQINKGSKYADNCTAVAGVWEEKDGTLYLLCNNKKRSLLTYIVASKKGKVLREGRVDFAKIFGKAPATFYVDKKVRLDKKGHIVALYDAKVNGKHQKGMLILQTKKGKCTVKELGEGNWCLQDDGTPVLLPEHNLVRIDEGTERFEIYACHGKALYKIEMIGDIYKGTIKDENNFEKISTGSIYTADPAITADRRESDKEYFLNDCCVSGDETKLYVRYWKGLDDCFEIGDEVYYMVSYELA